MHRKIWQVPQAVEPESQPIPNPTLTLKPQGACSRLKVRLRASHLSHLVSSENQLLIFLKS